MTLADLIREQLAKVPPTRNRDAPSRAPTTVSAWTCRSRLRGSGRVRRTRRLRWMWRVRRMGRFVLLVSHLLSPRRCTGNDFEPKHSGDEAARMVSRRRAMPDDDSMTRCRSFNRSCDGRRRSATQSTGSSP